MKKIRNFMLIALGLGLVSTGCNDGGGETFVDNRDKVVGTYPVKVTAPAAGDLYTELALVKEGDAGLKVSATADVPGMGSMAINLVLSELKEYNEDGGTAVTGYLFRIAGQELNIMGVPMTLRGTGAYADGYDGKVYKNETDSFISFEIGDASGIVVIKVETDVYTPPADNRGNVVGTYPVKVDVSVLPAELYAGLALTQEDGGGLKVAATVNVPGMGPMAIDLVLSELKEYGTEGGVPVTGYLFKIAEQELSLMGQSVVNIRGTGEYADGYDGKVYKNETDAFISFEAGDEAGTVKVKVETAAAPVDYRDELAGSYTVNINTMSMVSIPTELILSKEGGGNLRAVVSVEMAMGEINMNISLSELMAYDNESGQTVIGYYFKIDRQEVDLQGFPSFLTGKGTYENGYDGKVYKRGADSFISFEIGNSQGNIIVKVETVNA